MATLGFFIKLQAVKINALHTFLHWTHYTLFHFSRLYKWKYWEYVVTIVQSRDILLQFEKTEKTRYNIIMLIRNTDSKVQYCINFTNVF